MQKIAEIKVQQYGIRGTKISLPKAFVSENKIAVGDSLNIYRDQIDGKDVLILSKHQFKPNGTLSTTS